MGISQKLWLTFGIMAACFATTIAITWSFAAEAGAGIQQVTEETLPLNNLSKDALTTFKLMVVQYERAGLEEDATRLDKANAMGEEFDAQFKQLLDSPLGATLGNAGQHWRTLHDQAPKLYRRVVVESDYSPTVLSGIENLRTKDIPEIETHLADFAEASRGSVGEAMGAIDRRNDLLNTINLVMLFVVIALVVTIAFTISGVRRSLTASWEVLDQNQRTLNLLAENLAGTSRDNLQEANTVSEGAQNMQTSVTQMAAAVEQMANNVNSISSASEELSTNMNHIASSVKEMNTSMVGVDRQAQDGAIVASNGTKKATATNHVMTTLGSAAAAIGEVTDLIKRIADQTNLLALNATIEAASAGDAGKGFAVVAAEIKELASQSAKAADDIAGRIQSIQSGSDEAVQATAEIVGIIETINESARSITTAMSEQSSVAGAITGNINESTHGVEDIAESIAQLATGSSQASCNALEAARNSEDIARRIAIMRESVEETARSAEQVSRSAEGMQRLAEQLKSLL